MSESERDDKMKTAEPQIGPARETEALDGEVRGEAPRSADASAAGAVLDEAEASAKADAGETLIRGPEEEELAKRPRGSLSSFTLFLAERADKSRQKTLKRTFADIIGNGWFYLALVFFLTFPLTDIFNKLQLLSGGPMLPNPSWRDIFSFNTLVGVFLSLPVYLAYGFDYQKAKRREEPWEKAKKKKIQLSVLSVFLLLFALAAIVSALFKL